MRKKTKIVRRKNGRSVLDTNQARLSLMLVWAVMRTQRKKIIKLLEKEKELAVHEIYKKLRLSDQSATSQLLADLRGAGVVNCRKEGQEVYYSLNYDNLKKIVKWFKEVPMDIKSTPRARMR